MSTNLPYLDLLCALASTILLLDLFEQRISLLVK